MTKPTDNASEAPDQKPKKVSPKLRFAQRLFTFKMADWRKPWRNLVTWTQYIWIIWHVGNFIQEGIATHYPSIPFFWVQPGQECCMILLNLSNWTTKKNTIRNIMYRINNLFKYRRMEKNKQWKYFHLTSQLFVTVKTKGGRIWNFFICCHLWHPWVDLNGLLIISIFT